MTRQKDDCLQTIDKPRSDLCAARPRASVYRLRCVGLAARSAKKVRRLSENSGNLITNANAGQVTIARTIIVV